MLVNSLAPGFGKFDSGSDINRAENSTRLGIGIMGLGERQSVREARKTGSRPPSKHQVTLDVIKSIKNTEAAFDQTFTPIRRRFTLLLKRQNGAETDCRKCL